MSRHPWTPPPTGSPLHPTSSATSVGESSVSARPNARPGVQPRNDFEAFIMSLDGPVAGFHPTTDEELAERFLAHGVAQKDIPQAIRDHDKRANENMRQWGGSAGIQIVGRKPMDNNFQVFLIPDTRVAIRIWDSGMESWGQYMMDFFDLDRQKAVNSPHGWKIHPVQAPGMMPVGPLVSWERSFEGLSANIPSGEEQFCVPQGSQWRLVREVPPRTPDIFFAVPMRTVGTVLVATPFRPGYT